MDLLNLSLVVRCSVADWPAAGMPQHSIRVDLSDASAAAAAAVSHFSSTSLNAAAANIIDESIRYDAATVAARAVSISVPPIYVSLSLSVCVCVCVCGTFCEVDNPIRCLDI